MGEMKSLFVDGVFDGRKVPSNIFLVAAINPARLAMGSPRAHERDLFNSRYIVRPCPASMEEAVWAFGSMSAVQENQYVTAKLQMVAAEWADVAGFDRDQSRLLMRYISTSQVRPNLSTHSHPGTQASKLPFSPPLWFRPHPQNPDHVESLCRLHVVLIQTSSRNPIRIQSFIPIPIQSSVHTRWYKCRGVAVHLYTMMLS